MSTTEDEQTCVEEAREIVCAAAALLPEPIRGPQRDGDDLQASDAALSDTRRALSTGLDTMGDGGAAAPRARIAELVLDSVMVQAKVKDALIERRAQMTLGVREALSTLRNATSTAALAARAPIEARRIGFQRALYSHIDNGTWLATSAFSIADSAFADELVAVGKANPRRLNGPLVESEMVRRCTPVVVSDAQSNPRVHLQMIKYADTRSYVAAPVLAWGVPVAMVHADHDSDGVVDDFDRYLLGVYAEGLGLALERTELMERMQAVRRATAEYVAGVGAIADDFTVDLLGSAGVTVDTVAERVAHRPGLTMEDHGERLTPREWDVLRNLASGKTNAQIATGLFVTEGTVKSHVKHILRKLGATNRTEAVARYHRMVQSSGGAKAG